MAGVNSRTATGGKQKVVAKAAWPTERWVAILVIGALVMLVAIRLGFRGINVLGVQARVS